jgi:hypothetical protein
MLFIIKVTTCVFEKIAQGYIPYNFFVKINKTFTIERSYPKWATSVIKKNVCGTQSPNILNFAQSGQPVFPIPERLDYYYICSVNDRSRFIRRLFTKRKLTRTSHIVQYCPVLPDRVLLYGPKIRGSTLVSLE